MGRKTIFLSFERDISLSSLLLSSSPILYLSLCSSFSLSYPARVHTNQDSGKVAGAVVGRPRWRRHRVGKKNLPFFKKKNRLSHSFSCPLFDSTLKIYKQATHSPRFYPQNERNTTFLLFYVRFLLRVCVWYLIPALCFDLSLWLLCRAIFLRVDGSRDYVMFPICEAFRCWFLCWNFSPLFGCFAGYIYRVRIET